MYLNALEEQPGHYLSASSSYTRNVTSGTTNTTVPKGLFLEYENEPYRLKVQYPYDWISELTITTRCHPRLVMPIHKLLALFIYLIQQMDFHSSI